MKYGSYDFKGKSDDAWFSEPVRMGEDVLVGDHEHTCEAVTIGDSSMKVSHMGYPAPVMLKTETFKPLTADHA